MIFHSYSYLYVTWAKISDYLMPGSSFSFKINLFPRLLKKSPSSTLKRDFYPFFESITIVPKSLKRPVEKHLEFYR